ncbi:DUF1214 domain-containing protein [Moritella marina ATCC 15381]|uniref:DUF1214 domain-containing protein n=1 Tax=Moritella marina ATCC 15381 TaxID=1202962 RepID=A0A5J6WM81_MORMI|nr:DUF1214 domain-containing protein [Moritella marina]QFI38341.1 DUF1214 domain-containing protein [Moritella marina ATCC 15381]
MLLNTISFKHMLTNLISPRHTKMVSNLLLAGLLTACANTADTPSQSEVADQQALEQAWAEFYATLGDVEQQFRDSSIYQRDPQHRIEAYELLSAITNAAMSGAISGGDGSYPHFRNLLDPGKRIGIDNPDTYYRAANVSNKDGENVYIITGNRGTTADFLLELFEAANPQGAVSVLDDNHMTFDANGNFSVTLSKDKVPGNWMELPQQQQDLIVIARYTHANWNIESAGNITIKRLGSEGIASKPSSATALTERIHNATSMVKRQGTFWPDFADKISWLPENTLISFRPTGDIGILGQYNSLGHYDLQDDEAMIIKLPEIESDYNGLHTMNYWAASPDWVNTQSSVSWGRNGKAQAYKSADGYYYIVASPKDPGIQDWVDTSSTPTGVLMLRIQSGVDDKVITSTTPETTVVKLSELRQHLPADIPMFTTEQRKQQLIQRQQHAAKRYQTW